MATAGLSLNATTGVISGTPTTVVWSTSYVVTATNSGGATTATLTIVINAVPTLSYSASTGTTGTVGTAMSITPSTLDANGAPITNCGIQSGTTALPAYLTVSPTTCVISGTPTSALSLTTYKLVATNSVGTSSTASVTLAAIPGVPTLSYSASTGTIGAIGLPSTPAMSIAPSALLANGASIAYCGIKGGTTALPNYLSVAATTCVISGTPTSALTATTYTLVATNSVGISASASVTLSVSVAPPTLWYGSYGTPYQFTGTVGTGMNLSGSIDSIFSITNCGIQSGTTALPSYLSVDPSTCAISGTPTSTLTATTYALTAMSSAGTSVPATVTLQFDAAAPILSYLSSTGTTGAVGTLMSVAPSTLSSRGASITSCGIKGGTTALPGYLNVNATTCVISGTPTLTLTATAFTLVATNSAGTSSNATVTLAANPGVPVLSYSSSTGTTGVVGTAMSVTPSALTTNGASITACGIKGGTTALPGYLSVNSATCAISGIPTSTLSATVYTLVASNSAGASSNAVVTLAANPGVPTLSFSTSTGITGTVGAAMSVTPSMLTTNGTSITACAIKGGTTALPGYLSVNATTCIISGMPTSILAATTYTLVATNSAGTSSDATVVLTAVKITSVSAGRSHTCAFSSAGTVYCWGDNFYGQLGNNSTTASHSPIKAISQTGTGFLSGITTVGSGDYHTCASSNSTGYTYCWGYNNFGQLGNNSTVASLIPGQIYSTPITFASVLRSSDGGFTCGLAAGVNVGGVYCWGNNFSGQLGNNSTTQSNVQVGVTVIGFGNTAIATGSNHACAISAAGNVFCWGFNGSGQLGNNTITDSHTPVEVLGVGGVGHLSGIVAIAAGFGQTCAVSSSGGVYCWGDNFRGDLGNNSTTESNTPVQVLGVGGSGFLSGIVAIEARQAHSCALSSSGAVYCWGDNGAGQLGNGSTTESDTPVAVLGVGGSGTLSGISAISAGMAHSCALSTSGVTFCWGANSTGQLGDGSTTSTSTPVQVTGW
ncbi:putative Ig domain-containing protein [Bdellovibrionota bacterium FG-1]